MKANEIRLGNLFKCYNFDLTIGSINKEYVGHITNEGGFLITDLEPIPLTEEWLVKFGFEDNGLKMSGTKWLEFKRPFIGWGDYRISQRTENEWSFTLECVVPPTNAIANIQYVHQLQNLYFALTNTELILQK